MDTSTPNYRQEYNRMVRGLELMYEALKEAPDKPEGFAYTNGLLTAWVGRLLRGEDVADNPYKTNEPSPV